MDTANIRPMMALNVMEKQLQGILNPPISRHFLYNLIQDGSLEGKKLAGKWYVYEDSYLKWLQDIQQPEIP